MDAGDGAAEAVGEVLGNAGVLKHLRDMLKHLRDMLKHLWDMLKHLWRYLSTFKGA